MERYALGPASECRIESERETPTVPRLERAEAGGTRQWPFDLKFSICDPAAPQTGSLTRMFAKVRESPSVRTPYIHGRENSAIVERTF